jgi:hypothetical protein
MFQRTLTLTLVSSLLIGTTGLFASRANADATVDFEGTVDEFCDFVDGSGNATDTGTAGALSESGQQLTSTGSGSSGSIDIECNTTNASLDITGISEDGNNPFGTGEGVTLQSTATLGGDTTGSITFSDGSSDGSQTLSVGSTDVTLDFIADFAGTTFAEVPAGDYNYTVTLTLTTP